jgi:hypothetical protein
MSTHNATAQAHPNIDGDVISRNTIFGVGKAYSAHIWGFSKDKLYKQLRFLLTGSVIVQKIISSMNPCGQG